MSCFMKIFSEVNNIFKVKGQEQKLKDIDITVVNIFMDFQAPYSEVTKSLEGEKYPTMHHVHQWHAKLKRCMIIIPTDCLTRFLEIRGSRGLDEKFQVTLLHKLALFFNPKFRILNALRETERLHVMDMAWDHLLSLFPSSEKVEKLTTHQREHSYAPKKFEWNINLLGIPFQKKFVVVQTMGYMLLHFVMQKAYWAILFLHYKAVVDIPHSKWHGFILMYVSIFNHAF